MPCVCPPRQACRVRSEAPRTQARTTGLLMCNGFNAPYRPTAARWLQVHGLDRYVARTAAASAVRQDERFQANMRSVIIRAAVDAVIAEPEAVTRLRNQEALFCLHRLRAIRDVHRQHGGGKIDLDLLCKPWEDDDDKQNTGAVLVLFVSDPSVCVCLLGHSAPLAEESGSSRSVHTRLHCMSATLQAYRSPGCMRPLNIRMVSPVQPAWT